LISLLHSPSALSQYGKIEGYIIDSQGTPIANLHASLLNTVLGDVSDYKGHFIIEKITPGIYALRLDHIGYQEKMIENVEVRENQTTHLSVMTLIQSILDMEEVVVTATRTDHSPLDVPQPINLVPESRIRERNAKTSAEALREETGIFIQKTNHGGGSAIIRGLSSNQILILVDGVRLNNSTYRLGNHQYLTTIDNHLIRQIEVVRGPTSVLYGSDAMGGTINVITKKPVPYSQNLTFDYRLLSRYASVDEEKTMRADLSLQNHHFAVLTGFSYKDYSDLKRGKNSHYPQLENSTNGLRQSPTGFTAYDFNTKLVYNPTPSQSFIFAYQMARQKDVPRYDKYESNDYIHWFYEPQVRNLVYLTYENNIQSKYITSIRSSISYHRQKEGRKTQKSIETPMTQEIDDVGTLGLSMQLNSLFRKHLFTYGIDLYFDKVSSERTFMYTETGTSERDERGRYPDGARYDSYGFFFQDELHINPKWTLTPGIRFGYFNTKFTISRSGSRSGQIQQDFKSITSSMGLIYKLSDRIYLNANVGQAFRAPNLSDLTKLGESKGNTYEVPNPDLVPEKMLSFDTGFKLDFEDFKMQVSTYYASITDLLASAEANENGSPTIEINDIVYKVKAKTNIGNAFIRGFEASLVYNLYKFLSLQTNISSTFGQNTTAEEPVGGIPPLFGRIGLKWNKPTYHFDLYMRFAGKQDRLSTDDLDDPRIPEGGTPGWQTINVRTGFELWNAGNIQFAIENICDTNYREHGSGINGPGRNLIVSLEIKP